jgi:plasmid stabilization system protein ParE
MKSQYTAFRAQETIRQEVKILAKHPQLGRLIDDLPSEFRELVITFGQGAYIARYRFNLDSIVILALRNAREAGY